MIDSKLNFYSHIDVICKKAIQIFSALSRISPFKQMPKGRLLINAFFMASRFNYCPPVCMRHRNIKNDMSNCRHERCLRITYTMINTPHLENYQKKIILLLYTNELCVSLLLKCSGYQKHF